MGGSVEAAPRVRPSPVAGGDERSRPPGRRSGDPRGERRDRAPRHVRPSRHHRLTALSPPWRAAVLAMVVLAVVAPLAQAGRALADDWRPIGDNALIGLRARDVVVDPPTVGQPNSGDSVEGVDESSHLGPIESYLLAVPVRVLGPTAGLALGAALLNGLAVATALVLGFRRGGPVLFGLLAAGLPLLVRGVGVGVLHDPINSDIATLSLVPLALAAWSLWEDDRAVVAAFALLSAVVLQPHLGNAPFGGAAVLVGLVGLGRSLRRHGVGRDRRRLLAGLAVLVLAWLPPLCGELFGSRSNLAAIWEGITSPKAEMGLPFGLQRLATAVVPSPVPFFARSPRFALPVGYPGRPTVVVGLLLVGLAGSLAVVLHDRRHRTPARLLAVVPVLLVVAAVATARLPIGGVIRPEHGRWMWAGGLLLWVALLWGGWTLLPRARRRALAPPATGALLALGAVAWAVVLAAPPLQGNTGTWMMPRLDGFAADIRADLPEGRYLLEPQDPSALITVVPALVLELDEAGYRTFVAEGTFHRGYDDHHFVGDGTVLGRLVISAGDPSVPPPGGVLVADQPGRPGATGDAGSRLRAYLVPT